MRVSGSLPDLPDSAHWQVSSLRPAGSAAAGRPVTPALVYTLPPRRRPGPPSCWVIAARGAAPNSGRGNYMRNQWPGRSDGWSSPVVRRGMSARDVARMGEGTALRVFTASS
jgi:hypothetical protein